MKNQNLFNKYNTGNRHWDDHPTRYAEFFCDFLEKNGFDGLLIDAGCGSGRDTNYFNNRRIKVLGIDYSKEEIDNARLKYPGCDFDVQNVENLKLDTESVNAIFCINLIHYTDEKKTLSEFARILKLSGYLYIHFNLEIKDIYGNIDHKMSEEEIMKTINNFTLINKNIIERTDRKPVEHTHKILELILKKK